MKSNRAALNAVKYLGGMEAEHGGIAKLTDTNAIKLLTKGVGCVINDL